MSEPNDTLVQRKYSVAEIDAMRHSVERMSMRVGGPNNGPDFDVRVEQRLRTYMVAGAEPGELEASGAAAFQTFLDETEKHYEQLTEYWARVTEESTARRVAATPPRKPRLFSSEWWG